MELDELLYNAITANAELVSVATGGIKSTCNEVPPVNDDNTPVPYIIIIDEGFSNELGTKDDVWEGDVDHLKAGILIAANDPDGVRTIRRKVRQAVADYVATLDNPPFLTSFTNEGIEWDWQKPCYYDVLHYQCDMDVVNEESES